jgi:hypothetical protein
MQHPESYVTQQDCEQVVAYPQPEIATLKREAKTCTSNAVPAPGDRTRTFDILGAVPTSASAPIREHADDRYVRSGRGELRRIEPIQIGVFAQLRVPEPVSRAIAEGGEGEQALVKHADDVAWCVVAAVGGKEAP